GGMMSVLTSQEWIEEALAPWDGRLWIAAVNGPASVSVSGDPDALAEFGKTLSKAKIYRWQLPGVDFAGHSGHVTTIKEELHQVLDGVTATPGHTAWMSTVTADWADPTHITTDYWYRNLHDTVRFHQATQNLLNHGYRTFIRGQHPPRPHHRHPRHHRNPPRTTSHHHRHPPTRRRQPPPLPHPPRRTHHHRNTGGLAHPLRRLRSP
ncbi:acyltransferase domain-containing protein, partial [Streptomyces sp. NEAU-174]|uniref:acyltransferase domain-containing protein n=1 Tax=Streptomyces sp. NEAU-174 TaxID=3458254 RepID=UPI004044E1DC